MKKSIIILYKPKNPAFKIIAANIILNSVETSTWTSGNQIWNGQAGNLINIINNINKKI